MNTKGRPAMDADSTHKRHQILTDVINPFIQRVFDLDRTQTQPKCLTVSAYIQAYTTIYQLCTQHNANLADLYEMISKVFNIVCEQIHRRIVCNAGRTDGHIDMTLTYLNMYKNRWAEFALITQGICRMFVFLDKCYTSPNMSIKSKPRTIHQLAHSTFYNVVMNPISEMLTQHILTYISYDMTARSDMSILNILNSIKEVGACIDKDPHMLYKNMIEYKCRDLCIKVCRDWHTDFLCSEATFGDYLSKIHTHIFSMMIPCVSRYVSSATLDEIRGRILNDIFDDQILKDNRTPVCNIIKGGDAMYPLIKMMLDLFKTAEIVNSFKYVIDYKLADISNVACFITAYSELNDILVCGFQGRADFKVALNKSMCSFMNKKDQVPFDMIYSLNKELNDTLLKNTMTPDDDTRIKKTIDTIVMLYGFINDKDVFEVEYQKRFAQRLLNKTFIHDNEQYCVSRMKIVCGCQVYKNLTTMLNDIKGAPEIRPPHSTDVLCPSVLTSSCWSLIPQYTKFVMPRELQDITHNFTLSYKNAFNGRRLNFDILNGSAELAIKFNSVASARTLVVSPVMMLVLLIFNKTQKVKFEDIVKITGVDATILKNHVLSLAHPKIKVILKSPMTKAIGPSDTFILNDKFNYKQGQYRVNIPLADFAATETEAKSMATATRIANIERPHLIDACIVRIMKARRLCAYDELYLEVSKQLMHKFAIDTSSMKTRLEYLIESEYLTRDDATHKLKYVA